MILVQTDFSLSEVGQTTGKPAARFDRRRRMEVTLTMLVWLYSVIGSAVNTLMRRLKFGLSPSPRLSMNF